MQRRPFGRSGIEVPIIGQGTWRMEAEDRGACIEALRAGFDAGMTHVDTAEMYGSGEVEELVGEAIAGRRDELFLVSKVWPQNATYQGARAACERSLRRLRTDRLDLFLLHWPGRHPLEETVRAFEDLVKAGKTRLWGVSNFDTSHLEQVLAIAGEHRIACDQVLYHLGERAIEHAVLPWCERHGVAVVAYSPFGSGLFPSARSEGGRTLSEVAREHQATPHQVALSFLTRRPSLFAIPKASRREHALTNAAAGDLGLSDEEIARIEAAFPRRPRKEELPMI